ncbi:hypothetical protein CRYUN_Cryun35bG0060300 [Craigia yunnanensis]
MPSFNLLQLDGKSHVIYAEEEAAGTRLLIDGRTCQLQNDHDPSKLAAKTPCKLLRFLVSDGSHIDADTPYTEVEAGELSARLDLDDPSAIRKAEPFHGNFPVLGLRLQFLAEFIRDALQV